MKKTFSLKALLFAIALVAFAGVAFSGTKAYAGEDPTPAPKSSDYEWTYVSADDAVKFTAKSGVSPASFTLYVISTGEDTTKTVSKATKSITVDATGAALVLNDKQGIKYAETKDLHLFATSNKITKGEYTADITIAKADVSKIKATLDYSKAATGSAVAAVKVEYATLADKKTMNEATLSDVEFAVYNKKAKKYTTAWAAATTFTGEKLQGCMETTTKAAPLEVHFRIKGADGKTTAKRPSKIAKASIKTPGKQAVVKYNAKKNVLPIKNGFDYLISNTTKAAFAYSDDWKTILPFKKDEGATATISTSAYTPAKYDKENAANNVNKFTGTKVASLSLDDAAFANDCYIYMRKSAKVGAPATAVSTDKAFYYIKNTAAKVELKSASGTALAASTAALKFSVKQASSDPATGSSITYEYAIVLKSDLASIDMTTLSWTASKNGEVKVNAKTTKTSKYKLTTDGADDKAAAKTDVELKDCYLIVRRAACTDKPLKDIKDKMITIYKPSAYQKFTFTVEENDKSKLMITAYTAEN